MREYTRAVPERTTMSNAAGRLGRVLPFTLAAWALAAPGCIAVEPPDTDLDARTLTVGLLAAAPPYSAISPDSGAFEGWSVDLIRALAERANFQPVFQAVDAGQLIASLESGAVHVVPVGIPLTIDNYARVGFSAPYLFLDHHLIVQESSPFTDVNTFRTIADRPVAVTAGDLEVVASARAFFGVERVLEFPTPEEALRALQEGAVAATVLDEVQWSRRRLSGLRALRGAIFVEAYALATARDAEHLDPISFALEALRRDGTLDSINVRWGLPPIALPAPADAAPSAD